MDDSQQRIAEFVERHDLETPPAYRLLDLASEVGELAKDANESTDYGAAPADLEINTDELGDVLFATFALADALEIDGDDALQEALTKYESRLEDGDSPGSGQ
ncbi:nucleotide pyrophosphohydrolase [Salinadaptatus halalkaliphilus]|uniref:Nucleotide pyrophosphohydrolase n=1 Tax=Salinadaptatus halalkaliphilus TaxID=2419781 RepID=A0A4S3TQQ2_9EURY|nr:MazG-like family protein [Salinadaptatus halalkaliphilus]THE66626.1 nucleotide pyrophosphohydrolase [Salinadaptatus halalkaliphilus]